MDAMRLAAAGVIAGFEGREVLRGLDLTVPAGSRVALLGANGSGKTTLLRTLAGAHRPSAGQVLLDGEPVRFDRAGLREHRRRVQLVLQDPDDQLFSADVRQDVSFGPLNLGLSEEQAAEATDAAIAAMGIEHLADRPTHQLSYGERKRAVIAGALAMNVDVLLLDEPTAGLDPAGVEALLQTLVQINERGTTLVFSTHEVDNALAFATHAAVMTEGKLRQGGLVELLSDAELLAAARLRQPILLQLSASLGWETPVTTIEQFKERWLTG
ncbi:energy-coupling factor ABC transporter ATP-binding protein [Arachnia rubra]|jgi:putative ABC transporter ATP-binding protein in cobA 5'region|uniref:ABC transporter ATP-binding protein n=1 Tax=Arachnia rubra TaxID=1547448 RepID=A0ABX7Y1S1_9ACTN|nr:ATP-binding cassette domain-containing protein [Arachnia rubra]MBB1571385.1 ATP-binding cassette domain-containing protein [Propionibacterium sp.]MDO4644633.1 ATP-binding cassette domain-containing protein [Propionibacteriaceae bacterium]MBB1576145.1 ATP-binding cassette domain-containing protein [Propionibacterium sp.]QUC07117.1 ATP-binding cassette domain-containing protein [Arachnia rubra]BCR81368.1 putative ABC transporter ATP-binding protein [Arachnia rubra]